MRIKIVSLEKTLFDGDGTKITAPGAEGEFTILSGHVPFITALKRGSLHLESKNNAHDFLIVGGFLHTNGRSTTVLLR